MVVLINDSLLSRMGITNKEIEQLKNASDGTVRFKVLVTPDGDGNVDFFQFLDPTKFLVQSVSNIVVFYQTGKAQSSPRFCHRLALLVL